MILEWDKHNATWGQNGPQNARLRLVPLHNGEWYCTLTYQEAFSPETKLEHRLPVGLDLAGVLNALANDINLCFLPTAVQTWLKLLRAPVQPQHEVVAGVTFVIEAFTCPTPGPRRWVVVGRALTQHDAEVIAHQELASGNPVRILREVTPDCVGQWAPEACTRT